MGLVCQGLSARDRCGWRIRLRSAELARRCDGQTLFDRWLSFAERKAKLPKLDGSLWYAYRQKWAIERKGLPLKDVAAAGGWKDVNTLLEVYQQSDEESVLAVTSVTLKLRERGVA